MKQRQPCFGHQSLVGIHVGVEVNRHQCVRFEFCQQTLEAGDQIVAFESARAQIEDVRANVANGCVEGVDDLLQAFGCADQVVVGQQSVHIFERKPHCVN